MRLLLARGQLFALDEPPAFVVGGFTS
jgi:hypothetical protein